MTGRFNTVLCASVSGVDSDKETISRSLGHQEKSCGFGEVKSADSKKWKDPSSHVGSTNGKNQKSYFGFEGKSVVSL